MHICLFCTKEFKNSGGLGSHKPYCKLNPNRTQRKINPKNGFKKNNIPWNKGMEGLNGKPAWNKGIKGSTTGKASTEEKEILRKQKISLKAKEKNGGYRKGSGIGKKGFYKGIWCDSSWELAYVIYCKDNNIHIERNKEKRIYEFEGLTKNYIPDFIVEDKLVEIKGYKSLEWEAKHKANKDISVLYGLDLKPILDYVIGKYGKDFIFMYE